MRRERWRAFADKFRSCERIQAKAVGLTEAQRNHRPMEQRRAVRLKRAAVPIRKLRTGPRLVLNRLNQPTSRGRSSFLKSLSAPAPQLSQALQETTEPLHSQQAQDSAN